MNIDPKWIALIDFIKKNPYSRMEIEFKEGKPSVAEHIKESIKF